MIDLKPHQTVALQEMHDGNILWGRVGSGKGRVAVGYYELYHQDKDVYVITTAKKRDSKDWEGEFARIAVSSKPDICTENPVPNSVYGDLTVDSWNNLHKYSDIEGAFFIFDEQRLVGSGLWVKSFLKIARKNKWIMLSATPGDTWLDYIPIFVANGFYKNRTAFKAEHVIYEAYAKFPKVKGYLNEGKLIQHRNRLLVRMRYENETVRHVSNINVEYNKELFQQVVKERWHIFQNRPIRDIAELFAVLRRIVNTDPSRLRKIRNQLDQNEKIIIYYNFNYELDILRELSDQTTVAEWNGHKHEEIPKTDSWVYLVQYIAGAEAWECTETDTMLFYSPTYSYKHWEQSHGRIDRMNTPFTDLYYLYLRSKSPLENGIWRSLKDKKNFNVNDFPVESLGG